MPTQKIRLNRSEQERYHADMQDLVAAGLEIDVTSERLPSQPFLHVGIAFGLATTFFELPTVGVGYAIQLQLISRQSHLILSQYKITTAWDRQIEPVIFETFGPVCEFGWLSYPRNDILNFRWANHLRFDFCGQLFEGTILAVGSQAIPARYLTGASVPFEIAFTDSLGHAISLQAELYVDRIRRRKNLGLRSAESLYDPLAPRRIPAASEPDGRMHLKVVNSEEYE